MSPHAANSLVHDLVQMAQAMEQLPQVQAQLDRVNGDLEHAFATIQRLELKLLDRANQIDTLNASLRAAEVAKDAAETMFLEADERTQRALDFIKATFGNAGSLIQALEPPKPEPKPINIANEALAHTEEQMPPAVPEGLHSEGPKSEGTVVQVPDYIKEPVWDEPNVAEPLNPFANEAPTAEAGVSVPVDPTPAMETSSENVSSDSVQPESTLDPEPTQRWTNEWWAWKDRQPRNAAE